jgi:hypothetical protein
VAVEDSHALIVDAYNQGLGPIAANDRPGRRLLYRAFARCKWVATFLWLVKGLSTGARVAPMLCLVAERFARDTQMLAGSNIPPVVGLRDRSWEGALGHPCERRSGPATAARVLPYAVARCGWTMSCGR